MENFIFSINTALPILLMTLLGMVLKKYGVLNDNSIPVLDRFAFKVGLPALMFHNVATMDFYSEFSASFVLYCAGISLASFLIIWYISLKLFPDRSMAGAFAQGSVRGSVAVLGAAIVSSIYGSAGIAALMVAASVPIYNVMSVIILTFCGSSISDPHDRIRSALKGIITNPLILGIIAALPFALLRIELPKGVYKAISDVATTATPLSLMVIGASFSVAEATARFKPALLATAIKLLIFPALSIPLAVMLGFRDAALTSIILMVGSASAPAGFLMARNMGCDGPLSANIIMLSQISFPFTLAMWLFILKSLALI